MWPLFVTTTAYAMNTFASEALNGFSPFQLVFVCDPLDLTSLSFPQWLVDYYLSGELNKHLNLKIKINNLQKKKSLRIIKWYTSWLHIHQHCK